MTGINGIMNTANKNHLIMNDSDLIMRILDYMRLYIDVGRNFISQAIRRHLRVMYT